MEKHDMEAASALIRKEFELRPEAEAIDEAAFLDILSKKIADMLEHEPEQLMSMLYRLDVEERKILPVMHIGAKEPAPLGLARLVIERQKQRMETKRTIKTKPLEGDAADWVW